MHYDHATDCLEKKNNKNKHTNSRSVYTVRRVEEQQLVGDLFPL